MSNFAVIRYMLQQIVVQEYILNDNTLYFFQIVTKVATVEPFLTQVWQIR